MPEPEEPEQRRKIFVGSLVFKTDEKDLKEFYSQFGEITDCVVMKVGQWQKKRPDTRPPVADGWAGAEMRVFRLFDLCSPTDRPTD